MAPLFLEFLDLLGSASFRWSVLVLPAPVLTAVIAARAHGFPGERVRTSA
ncbi:hypothetical protein [Streptomyces sp. NPDC005322]